MSISTRFAATVLFATTALTAAACSDNPTGASATPAPVIIVKNEANVPITMVHLAPCIDDGWGNNRLPSGQTIGTGATRTFGVTPGCWDVRASTGAKFGTWWDRYLAQGDTLRVALSSAANSLQPELVSWP